MRQEGRAGVRFSSRTASPEASLSPFFTFQVSLRGNTGGKATAAVPREVQLKGRRSLTTSPARLIFPGTPLERVSGTSPAADFRSGGRAGRLQPRSRRCPLLPPSSQLSSAHYGHRTGQRPSDSGQRRVEDQRWFVHDAPPHLTAICANEDDWLTSNALSLLIRRSS